MDLIDPKGTIQFFNSCVHVIENPVSDGSPRETIFGDCEDSSPYPLKELATYLRRRGFEERAVRVAQQYKFP